MKAFILFPLALSMVSDAKPLDQKMSKLFDDNYKHMEAFYQDLHANPELSGEEVRTAEKVAAEMKRLGLQVMTGIGGHGVVGVLKNGDGPVTLVRAELDGLPVTEDTKVPYKSKNPGKMHACGHDFHVASILGAAYLMANNKDSWKGTLVFVAQPAEETVKGAKAMLKDGLYKKVPKPNQTIALHTSGMYKRGTVGITPGYALANADSADVIFRGKGTHGSKPEMGVDPFIQAAEFTLKLQTLLGREKPSDLPGVISVGSIHGGAKHNIIPEEVKLQLTIRTYQKEVREMIHRRIQEIAKSIAKANNAPEPTVTFPESIDATYNDPVFAERMKKLFIEKLGKDVVIDTKAIMGGEDFGLFGKEANAPSLIFWVGEKDEKNPKVVNHSPHFAPDFKGTYPLAVSSLSVALLDLHKK